MSKTFFFLLFSCVSINVFGQQINLLGVLKTDAGSPVPETPISVAGGQAARTDPRGKFKIVLSNDFKEGERVIIIVGKPNWVINSPLDGEWNLPNLQLQNLQPLNVIIVPKGSKALWTHARIEKYLAKISDEIAKRKKEDDKPLPVNFSEYISQGAKEYGFTPEEVRGFFDEWAKEVENAEDYKTIGLREFYKKNFAAAAVSFDKAAEKTAAQVKQDEKKLGKDKLEAYETFKLAGNTRTNLYEFREALQRYVRAESYVTREENPTEWGEIKILLGNTKNALGIRVEGKDGNALLAESVKEYERALQVYTREQAPQDWAATQNNLGVALKLQGERSGGEESVRLLGEAVTAYREALKVYTREQLPQQWAMAQSNLGVALRLQGERSGGEESVRLLGEAVTAHREALKVYTREQLPQQWARTQNNLGIALRLQGERSGGEESVRLLGEAVTAYREALKVRTREQLPQDWATTQNNLGKAYFLLKNWNDAAVCFEYVLTLYPSYDQGYQSLTSIYHEWLFEYAKAFELHQKWLSRFPQDTTVLPDFAETHFTTGRFPEFSQRIKPLLTDPELSASTKIALQMIEVANLLALDNADQVPAALAALNKTISDQKADFRITWSFGGTLNFINRQEKFASYRSWLNQFFSVAREENRDAIVEALREAQSQFPAMKSNQRK